MNLNKSEKEFVLKALIPFIMSQQGNGFAMSTWKAFRPAGALFTVDHVKRVVPPCGTVACLGGSIEMLKKIPDIDRIYGRLLGMTHNQREGLFYHWPWYEYEYRPFCWPRDLSTRFFRARTTEGKARVACALLRRIVKFGGQVMHNKGYKG